MYEITFSLLQCAKVLKHNKITFAELIQSNRKYSIYKEETPVFSYYIVKSVLLYYMNEFIGWTIKQNPKQFIDFKKTHTNVDSYIGFIYSHSCTSDFNECMKEIEGCLLEHYPAFLRTMRMTLHDE